MAVFITVGTTSFDKLIQEINARRFHLALLNLGYRKVFIQYGSGTVEPSLSESLLEVVAFRYRVELNSIFSESSLVISHGGAGTCMEALSPPGGRKLIVVINEDLMNNHQEELASTLYEGKHAFVSRVKDLYEFISTGKQNLFLECQQATFWRECEPKVLFGPSTTPESVGLIPFYRGNASLLIDFLNNLLDVPHTR
ncbi:UDP-N-acetylglucosamine transferase subunit ALG13 -like protein [Echinococcus granulosus]|uniref:UDP-N-acetylglucosamine transferase subunit ALG13 n=1 Tax=Echinococcus granulosus TaxID=6210 RepID=U6J037_ECHGR|nr:UDP-N-acetylglucosamine transferase subunit ALG13 [Echinococcus granulosus]EUB57240.1 UDP-N-acetylglucosamine transferase subunit ALG13 [Echinococcus granulosus]KAH9286841.1 UDP-N-acetylglucosamine transferase subunit ALG13 -like protein [Echinococcus granulosus]CDS15773.1 asparagine linked glycosylation 13 [Echinococcus granulosus]